MANNWTLDDLKGKKYRSLSIAIDQPEVKKKNISPVPLEEKEQKQFIKFLDFAHPTVLYCASAGGMRTSPSQANKMKATGYKAGFPDVAIYEPRGTYKGLFIEMKRVKGGVVSDEQKWWKDQLEKRGYKSEVCKGAVEAIELLENYLKL